MQLNKVTYSNHDQRIISDLNWHLQRSEAWAVLGTNACGKTTLGMLLSGELLPTEGTITTNNRNIVLLSLESQQALYERERYRDDTDFMDHIDEGTPVSELLTEVAPWGRLSETICNDLNLNHLLKQGYRSLSTGEARRVMLARALLTQPDFLVLDEPFEGLDAQSRADLHGSINRLVAGGQPVLLLINQITDLCDCFDHLALMDQGRFLFAGKRPTDFEAMWQHLLRTQTNQINLPGRQSLFQLGVTDELKPLIVLTNGFVQYDDVFQFQNFNWTLSPGHHTHIVGPNGSGKSTLLGLITGDHPQCYRNNINIFGFQRGRGESIWDIKRHLGYLSGNLHRDYRVAGNALTAVLSGLTDSIGVYQAVGEQERDLAEQWLALIGLTDKANTAFRQLSMGEQRLVLIARALIKQPPLLILDEPTQGLDDFNRFYVLAMIEQMVQDGPTTLLFVSHREDERLDCISNVLTFVPSKHSSTRFDVELSKASP